jgi:poly-gamma-glutamate synthesis protein (capsule biosynthesis protein)
MSSAKLRCTLAGDVMPAGMLSEGFDRFGGSVLPERARPWFDADVVFANLECPATDRVGPVTADEHALHSSPRSLQVLRDLNVSVVSLANNHMLDHGFEAVEETMARLDSLGIRYAGVGRDLDEARKPAVLRANGSTVAVLCYSWTDEWGLGPPGATSTSPGVNPLRVERVLEDLQEVRTTRKPDYTVVSFHWGQARTRYALPECVGAARAVIGGGADLIVGHHPHCLQGYEVYRGRPIFYSLGNLVFGPLPEAGARRPADGRETYRPGKPREREAAVAAVTTRRGAVTNLEFLPLVQRRHEPTLTLPKGRQHDRILADLERLSRRVASRYYAVTYHGWRRLDILARTWENVREDGLRDLTWRTPYRMARKLLMGSN